MKATEGGHYIIGIRVGRDPEYRAAVKLRAILEYFIQGGVAVKPGVGPALEQPDGDTIMILHPPPFSLADGSSPRSEMFFDQAQSIFNRANSLPCVLCCFPPCFRIKLRRHL